MIRDKPEITYQDAIKAISLFYVITRIWYQSTVLPEAKQVREAHKRLA